MASIFAAFGNFERTNTAALGVAKGTVSTGSSARRSMGLFSQIDQSMKRLIQLQVGGRNRRWAVSIDLIAATGQCVDLAAAGKPFRGGPSRRAFQDSTHFDGIPDASDGERTNHKAARTHTSSIPSWQSRSSAKRMRVREPPKRATKGSSEIRSPGWKSLLSKISRRFSRVRPVWETNSAAGLHGVPSAIFTPLPPRSLSRPAMPQFPACAVSKRDIKYWVHVFLAVRHNIKNVKAFIIKKIPLAGRLQNWLRIENRHPRF
jgi:hypothetical protein